jgi:hypothetical protein
MSWISLEMRSFLLLRDNLRLCCGDASVFALRILNLQVKIRSPKPHFDVTNAMIHRKYSSSFARKAQAFRMMRQFLGRP